MITVCGQPSDEPCLVAIILALFDVQPLRISLVADTACIPPLAADPCVSVGPSYCSATGKPSDALNQCTGEAGTVRHLC